MRTPHPLLGARYENPLPSPGRGWQGEALTGVGRYSVRPGTAPLPPLRRHLPPGEGKETGGGCVSMVYPRFWYSLGLKPVSFLKVPEK